MPPAEPDQPHRELAQHPLVKKREFLADRAVPPVDPDFCWSVDEDIGHCCVRNKR
jgi:hypothetical protein